MGRALPLAAAVLSGCFSPSLGEHPFKCGDQDHTCPPGYRCEMPTSTCVPESAPDGGTSIDGAVDAVPADAFLCMPGTSGCTGSDLVECDADAAMTHCDLGCARDNDAGLAHCKALIPSNVTMVDCTAAATDDLVVSSGTTMINTDTDCDVMETQGADLPELCIVLRRTMDVATGATLRAIGGRALVIVVTGDVTIGGTVDVSADHDTPGPGVSAPSADGDDGDCGGTLGSQRPCGGGGGGHATAGAKGGGSGTGGAPGGGAPGGIAGDSTLSPISAGGHGGSNQPGTSTRGGNGGALQIVACRTLTVAATGVLNAGGGGGGGGAGTASVSALDPANGGGGGGSGGAILLEGGTVMIASGANLAANGGGGGGGGGAVTVGTTPPAGGPGANGGLGAGAAMGGMAGIAGAGAGGNGGAGTTAPEQGHAATSTHGHGGGGGAVGRIRINSVGAHDTTGAVISPTAAFGALNTR